MADPSWLRILGGPRSRTPARLESTLPYADSRVGSSLSLGRQPLSDSEQTSRPVDSKMLPTLPPRQDPSSTHLISASTTKGSTETLVPESDRVWNDPSADRAVGTLLAVIMSMPEPRPLGPEYGSLILQLIEAYRGLRKRTTNAEERLNAEIARHRHERESFDTLTSEWMIWEARYKAEIKRLEVIIHQTSDSGLETLSMARSGSLLSKVATQDSYTSSHDASTSASEAGKEDKPVIPLTILTKRPKGTKQGPTDKKPGLSHHPSIREFLTNGA